MKINFTLKNLFVKHIKSIMQNKKVYSISGISVNDKEKLLVFLKNNIVDKILFVYEEKSNKYQEKLYVISIDDFISFIDSNNIFYSVDTLDFLNIFEYGHCQDIEDGIEVCATGKFAEIIKKLSLEFQYDKSESNIPD